MFGRLAGISANCSWRSGRGGVGRVRSRDVMATVMRYRRCTACQMPRHGELGGIRPAVEACERGDGGGVSFDDVGPLAASVGRVDGGAVR